MSQDASKLENNSKYSVYELWKDYENIAMHFNDLIMKIRLQALGGIGAILTIAGVGFSGGNNNSSNWAMLAGAFFIVTLAWIAIYITDIFYYNRLLRGAVIAIRKLENESKISDKIDKIELSNWVEKSVQGDINKKDELASPWPRITFYLLIFISLLTSFIFVFDKYCDNAYRDNETVNFFACNCFIEKGNNVD